MKFGEQYKQEFFIDIPQLIQSFLNDINLPIYEKLLNKAKYNRRFRLDIFLYLKQFLTTVDNNKASYLYFLMCDILDLEKSTRKRRKFQIDFIRRPKQKLPYFHGIFLFFVKCVSFPFVNLKRYYNCFLNKKNFKNVHCSKFSSFFLKRNVYLYSELVKIPQKLAKIPLHLRQKCLEIELQLLNGVIAYEPFGGKYINNILATESIILNSAENVPFMMFVEVSNKKLTNSTVKHGTSQILLKQLNSVNELTEVDVGGVRENIIEALEQVLFQNENKSSEDDDIEIIDNDPINLYVDKKTSWNILKNKIKNNSSYKDARGYELKAFIVKHGDNMSHEYLTYQILTELKRIFKISKLDLYLRNYQICLVDSFSAIVEVVTDCKSVHSIKADFKSLDEYFTKSYTDQKLARSNFLNSLTGYSIACYLLQMRDRHNANILIDNSGHLIHVDFGFVLGRHPGFYAVENAPFKFHSDYLEMISMETFKEKFIEGFKAVRKNCERLKFLIETMEGTLFCDYNNFFVERLKLEMTDEELDEYCSILIERSLKSMRTVVYDQYQYYSNGYY